MTTETQWDRAAWVASLVPSLSAVVRIAPDQPEDAGSLETESTVHWLLTPAATEQNDKGPALCGIPPLGWWWEQTDWTINVEDWCPECFRRAAEIVTAPSVYKAPTQEGQHD